MQDKVCLSDDELKIQRIVYQLINLHMYILRSYHLNIHKKMSVILAQFYLRQEAKHQFVVILEI